MEWNAWPIAVAHRALHTLNKAPQQDKRAMNRNLRLGREAVPAGAVPPGGRRAAVPPCLSFLPQLRPMETTEWVDLSDKALLDKKISQLGLTLAGTSLEPLVQQLYDELTAKGNDFIVPRPRGETFPIQPDRALTLLRTFRSQLR